MPMLRYGARVAFLVALVGVVWLAASIVARRDVTPASSQYIHTCSNATIAGQYGFQDDGIRIVDGKEVQYTAVRTAQFSGDGKHEGKGYLSIGGNIKKYTVQGKFAVAGDCTFTMEATQTLADGSPPVTYKQFGVIVRGGKEILEIQTSIGKIQ